jgi:hypothetical protein
VRGNRKLKGARPKFFERLLAAFAVMVLTEAQQQAPDAPVYYVLPDSYFVTEECRRLLMVPSSSVDLAQAHTRLTEACASYSTDHDGYAWLDRVRSAQAVLDEFDPNPTLHDAILVEPRRAVPRTASTYVLFLVTSRAYDHSLPELRSAFEDLGNAIGGRDLAVWFENPKDPDRVDIDRSKWYCDHVFDFLNLGLDYNSGPYVVITSKRPDEWTRASDLVILKLAGISEPRTIALLNDLEQELRATGQVQRAPLIFKEIEERLLSATDRHPNIFHDIAVMVVGGKPG